LLQKARKLDNMSNVEMLLEELKSLTALKLEAAAAFIHQLKQGTEGVHRGKFNLNIEALSAADGEALARVIEENFERVNPSNPNQPR